ncbi:MAG: valine--tRNA ligase [Gammaproteobacteria bacterium]|nr:valine--tRNA ligase [Gammaproteobacteria bacterium]
MNPPKQLAKSFDAGAIEARLYQEWESRGYFAPSGEGPAFCIAIPPPNVTGTLHVGHAFQQSLMDAVIRYRRMAKYNTLWQTGTDHAAISTQLVVSEMLRAEGKTPQDVGRDAFIERVWKWKEESGGIITQQMRRIGASVDWSRERFTMDEGFSRAVIEVFVRLFEEGLIYKEQRLVNWDPELNTALSDLEVLSESEPGFLWYLRYPLEDGLQTQSGEGYLVVATTRPETMLGDSAVAVSPNDDRFKDLIGQFVRLPLADRKIPIVGDEHVDMEFGTGCLKITPAHDFNDYVIGTKHNLDKISVITKQGRMNEKVPAEFRGLDRFDARTQIVTALEQKDLLEKIEPYEVQVPRGERSGVIVEPLITEQWWVDIKPLAEPALKKVEDGSIQFQPKRWENVYYSWMRDLRDWCISRQQWWGHQIPAWYDDDGKVYVGRNEEEARAKAGLAESVALTRDPDVLDTWFSSALWTFGTLGWPEQTEDLQKYHPTDVLVTGHDIIFFWVARMIMLTLHFTKEIPFRTVFITGLVRDAEGQKMSKTKGNGLDPLDLVDGISLDDLLAKRTSNLTQQSLKAQIEKHTRRDFPNGIQAFGADALRFTFCAIASPTSSYNFDIARVEGYHFFCNKLWNAMRFTLSQTENLDLDEPRELSLADRWIRSSLRDLIQGCRDDLESYRFDLFAQRIYDFIWHEFCDWYLELTKPVLYDPGTERERLNGTKFTLLEVAETLLRLLHPAMPFITEKLWQNIAPGLGKDGESIMLESYPTSAKLKEDKAAETAIGWLKGVISAVRNIRGERQIPPNKEITVLFSEGSVREREFEQENRVLLCKLAKIASTQWLDEDANSPQSSMQIFNGLKIHVPFVDKQEMDAEHARLEKELTRTTKELEGINQKLENPNFTSRAPAHVVDAQRQKAQDASHKKHALEQQLEQISTAMRANSTS